MTKTSDPCDVIRDACQQLAAGRAEAAARTIRERYPFTPVKKSARTYSPTTMTKLFVRDGFIDRYRGTRLVHPGALRVLSLRLGADFPYHKNGKMSEAHFAYWELFPTVDHLVPVARGGLDDESNWVTCSMRTNQIKGNWTLDELGWQLRPAGHVEAWDGMLGWFLEMVERDPSMMDVPYIRTWHSAARRASLRPRR